MILNIIRTIFDKTVTFCFPLTQEGNISQRCSRPVIIYCYKFYNTNVDTGIQNPSTPLLLASGLIVDKSFINYSTAVHTVIFSQLYFFNRPQELLRNNSDSREEVHPLVRLSVLVCTMVFQSWQVIGWGIGIFRVPIKTPMHFFQFKL